MTSYYDHILGLIPVAFTAIAAAMYVIGFQPTVAIPAAGGVAIVLVAHALFVNGPVEDLAPATAAEESAGQVAPVSAD